KEKRKYEITVFDAMTYASNPETVRFFSKFKNYRFIKGDIRDAKQVEKAVKKADVVVNFAAETHVDRSILDPGIFADTNIKGILNILDAAEKHGIKKIIHISTDEVYGSIKKGRSKETDILDPTSPYASSKAAADLMALSYYKTFGTPVIITRSSNNFGPYQHPEKFIPLFITNALEGKKLPLYGSGENIRNWIYVEDNCRAIEFVMRKGTAGEIYNIGGDTEETNIKVARTIVKKLGLKNDIIEKVKDRLAHDKRYALSSAKIKKTGWKPVYNFEKALCGTVDWYVKNEKWWKRLKNSEFKKYIKKAYKK
ncbi:MAG: dTDP-glucose 4,6-dehydratase, partial [bacterium]